MTESPFAVPDPAMADAATRRQGQLTKPPGALGRLEEIAIRLAALQGRECPQAERVQITVFAADHGVTVAGVSAFPPEVTVEMIRNFATGGAAINVLARRLGADLEVVDVGTARAYPPPAGVRQARVAWGSADLREHPALTREQFEAAWHEGEAAAQRAVAVGADLFIGGDMGIGNTTAAAAVSAALLHVPAHEVTGKGTGVDPTGFGRKLAAVEAGLARFHATGEQGAEAALRHLGGLEVVALAGAFTAAARAGLPVLVDGSTAGAAALAAVRRESRVRPWLIFAHRSAEAGHARVLAALGAKPLLDLGLRLGEGSGAAVAVPLLRLSCALHAEMATFDEAGLSSGEDRH